MRLSTLSLLAPLAHFATAHSPDTSTSSSPNKKAEPYPVLKSAQLTPVPYTKGDKIGIECIQRQIDTGEHKFDSENNIIYAEFPQCFETQETLSLEYARDSRFNCTFLLSDEIYHLFQLYIHEDSPFSCRLKNHAANGGHIPLTFNLRGNLETSHLDIDTKLNIIGLIDSEKGVIGSVNAFGSGLYSKRFIIGDSITLEFNNVWYDTKTENDSFDLKPIDELTSAKLVAVGLLSSAITTVVVIWLLYGNVNKKARRQATEFIEKKD